jgi:transcriptional regulator with XRE-family HTH domain
MKEHELRAILGKNVKFLRFHRQLSQADLAERAAISVTFLSNIERGNNFPKAGTICHLAEGLDVDVWELFKSEVTPDESRMAMERLREDMECRVKQTMNDVFVQYLVPKR